MANALQVFSKLLSHSTSEKSNIIDKTVNEYMNFIADLANDVFDSCINDYYSSYDPVVYKRHSNPDGFNLYRLKEIYFGDLKFKIKFDETNLLMYGARKDIREDVTDAVFNGQRGTTDRPNWPQDWYTSYPNAYSRLDNWQSEYHTIEEIFMDCAENSINDTKDMIWDIMSKYV